VSAAIHRIGQVPPACRDFCLWPYQPPEAPLSNALDGAATLLAAAELAGCGGAWRALVAALRAALGDYATVWGLKWDGAKLGVELYFYDYARCQRRVSLARVAAALRPFARGAAQVNEALPYFMVSVELPIAFGGFPAALDAADIYLGNPGSSVSSGICYRVADGAAELKNFYFFFDRAKEWEQIIGKLGCGMRVAADPACVERLLPDWLAECRTVVVANKRQADGLYCSGLALEPTLRFLAQQGWPPAFLAHLQAEAPRTRHLLWDIGFDFDLVDGRVGIGKSSLYGVF